MHIDTEQWRPLVHALASKQSRKALARAFPATPGTISDAYAITAEPDGILTTISPRVSAGSLSTSLGLTATGLREPGILPAGTLAYAGINDPGKIVRQLIIGGYSAFEAVQGTTKLLPDGLNIPQIMAHGDDIIQQIDKQIGINLDDQVFSWMHGDASVAILPVGSKDFGTGSPTTTLSLVATLQVTDQATLVADLAAIQSALQAIPGSGLESLRFTQVPTSAGNPLQMLMATPTGIGYTFYHGYLIVATALPADFAGIVQASTGNSLASDPKYRTAFSYFPRVPYGAAMYANLTGVREMAEKLAQASGADMRDYDRQVRPILKSFTSLATVSFAGPNGGSARFIGIGS